MLAGMIVSHQGRPFIVQAIQATTPGYTEGPPSVWTLAPLDGGDWVRLTGPKAEDVPLIPECDQHGTAAGWACVWDASLAHAVDRMGDVPGEWLEEYRDAHPPM